MKFKIAILGSTGSIGDHTLDIIRKDRKNFEVVLLTANKNYKKLIKQAKEFKVKNILIYNDKYYELLKKKIKSKKINIFSRKTKLNEILKKNNIRTYKTNTNFILMKFEKNKSQNIHKKLLSKGLVLRDLSSIKRLKNCLRFTIGLKDDNNQVIEEIVKLNNY